MRRTSDLWYNRIPRDSKKSDRLAGRTDYDPQNFITPKYLFHLQTKQKNKCYYCWEELNWMERRSSLNGLTVERLNGRKPHVKPNCVLACKSCNSAKFTREHGLIKRYFTKWRKKTFDIPSFVVSERSPSFL